MSVFYWAVFGSLATEVVNAYQTFQKNGKLPARYKKAGFWVVRVLVAAVAGGVAVAYDIDKPTLAIYIGAACPLIIQKLANGHLADMDEVTRAAAGTKAAHGIVQGEAEPEPPASAEMAHWNGLMTEGRPRKKAQRGSVVDVSNP